jgi:hypothetical protein
LLRGYSSPVNIIGPGWARGMASGIHGDDGEYLAKSYAGLAVDAITSLAVVTLSNSPEEAVGYKILANIGTHAFVDAIRFGRDKISHFQQHPVAPMIV